MQIKNDPLQSISLRPIDSACPSLLAITKKQPDSLCGLKWQTYYPCRVFAFIKRKIFNFFRAVLSYFISVSPREKVYKNEIEYLRKSEGGEEFTFRIRVNGFDTRNTMRFAIREETLVLLSFDFPDSEMHEHMKMIFNKVMSSENTGTIATSALDKAQILSKYGFGTEDKIRYNPEGKDERSQEIARIIENAKGQEATLSLPYVTALENIEDKLQKNRGVVELAGDFIDMGTSLLARKPLPEGVKISLKDLLTLSELEGVGSLKPVPLKAADAAPTKFNKPGVRTGVGTFNEV